MRWRSAAHESWVYEERSGIQTIRSRTEEVSWRQVCPSPRINAARRERNDAPRTAKRPDEEAWELVHPRLPAIATRTWKRSAKCSMPARLTSLLTNVAGCSRAAPIVWKPIGFWEKSRWERTTCLWLAVISATHFDWERRRLRSRRNPAPLPYRLQSNQSFLEAAKGLAWCLKELGKREMAAEVVAVMLRCDPQDPLGVRTLLDG